MKKKFLVIVPLCLILLGCTNRRRSTTKKPTQTNRSTTRDTKTTKGHTNTSEAITNKIIYVTVDGVIDNDGSSLTSSTTFLHALELMNSGDTISISEGVYEFNDTINLTSSGSEIKRNIITTTGSVTFDFTSAKDADNDGGITINASYWQIENITVFNANDYGFTISGRGIKMNNCTVSNCSSDYVESGGFNINTSLSTFTNCISINNGVDGINSYGFRIYGNGERNVFDSCIAEENKDSGYYITSTKAVEFNNCLALSNGINSDTLLKRSGFIFSNTGHSFTNCLAYNNDKFGFSSSDSISSGLVVKITNCSSINNHKMNYSLGRGINDNIEFINNLSFNNYDGDNNGQIDASNDDVKANVVNSILFYDKNYHYEENNATYDSKVTTLDTLDLSDYTNEFNISIIIPEEMKEYLDPEAKAIIDEEAAAAGVEPDYSGLEYKVIYFKDGVITLYSYLDRLEEFQDELFTNLSIDNYTYFGSNFKEKTDED